MFSLWTNSKDREIFLRLQCKYRQKKDRKTERGKSNTKHHKQNNTDHGKNTEQKFIKRKSNNTQRNNLPRPIQKAFGTLKRNKKIKAIFKYAVLSVIILGRGIGVNSILENPCLTGNFTDVQNWSTDEGKLSSHLDPSISLDLSSNPSAVHKLRLLMKYHDRLYRTQRKFSLEPENDTITLEQLEKTVYLSLASNDLHRIPLFYSSSDGPTSLNFARLHYLSFYGNNFNNRPEPVTETSRFTVDFVLNATDAEEVTIDERKRSPREKSNWASDLQHITLPNLLELDLRNCGIETLDSNIFMHLTNLRRLYLSHNKIQIVYADAFSNLSNLVHLDLSYNVITPSRFMFVPPPSAEPSDLMIIEKGAFEPLVRLKSLDLSRSRIVLTSAKRFSELPKTLSRLSICYTKFPSITEGFFGSTSIEFMDMSGNIALEALKKDAFKGIESSLIVLNANRLGIKSTDFIANLTKVRMLSLIDNDIVYLNSKHFENLVNLEILDLMNNRISNWNIPIFRNTQALEIVRLGGNNLNLMTNTMLEDLHKVKFLGIANNKFICNCDLRNFVFKGIMNAEEATDAHFELTWVEPNIINDPDEGVSEYVFQSENIYYLDVRRRFEVLLQQRMNITHTPKKINNKFKNRSLLRSSVERLNSSTIFLDYLDQSDICIDSRTSEISSFNNITCEGLLGINAGLNTSTFFIIGVVSMAVAIFLMVLAFWKWWYIRYFFTMIKNVAILSILGNGKGDNEEEKVFTYDVFVSYCDGDRKWVLEYLLPEVEKTTPISICLHERDFQVGLTILENIISSMDRSRVLMMVVSNQFLMSQWCQFEMHLAQHRLLETRREQLILVLLEDIPRRKRPNTLHYLMMTKTYIVWPKKTSEQQEFWKRLKKALLHGKNIDACSMA